MENFVGINKQQVMKVKRKEFEDFDDEFDFCLSSPARKIRRLDAELPPIIEDEAADIPMRYEQVTPENVILNRVGDQLNMPKIEELPASLPENEEKAIVLFKPMNNPASYSMTNFSVDPNLIAGFKNQALWGMNSNVGEHSEDCEDPTNGDNNEEANVCRAVIPWAPSHQPNLKQVQGYHTELSEPDAMDAEEPEATTMEVEDIDQQASDNYGLPRRVEGLSSQWQQSHCMFPPPLQNTTTPLVWYRRLTASKNEKYTAIESLTIEKDDWKIKARVSRLWNVVNANNKEELISIEMVLIDENNSYIHAIIKSNIAHTFSGVLKEGVVYMIKNFAVIENKNTYRVVSDSKIMLQFYSNTIIKEVDFELHKIPEHRFDLIHFEKLHERIGNIYILSDVVGEIISEGIIDTKSIRGRDIDTFNIEIRNIRNNTLKITLWGKAIEEYQKERSLKGKNNRVGVFTSNLVKEYQNSMYLSTTPASKFYLDLPISEVEEFKTSLTESPIKILEIPKRGIDKSVVLAKLKNIQDILEATTSDFQQSMTFYSLATIKSFSNKNGWNFPACVQHKTLAKAAGTKFWCQKCMLIIDDAVVRYRLETEVEDKTGSTKFIIFDDEAQKLIGLTAQQLYDIEEAKEEVDEEGEVPKHIRDLVGKSYVFEIKVTDFNKKVRNQSFTTYKIIDKAILNDAGQISTENQNAEDVLTEDVFEDEKNNLKDTKRKMIVDDSDDERPLFFLKKKFREKISSEESKDSIS